MKGSAGIKVWGLMVVMVMLGALAGCDSDNHQLAFFHISTPTATVGPTSAPTATPTAKVSPTPTAAPTPPPAACSGQGLIGIDPVANVAYVPIYPLDSNGNAQLAVVDLTVGVAKPVIKEISLTPPTGSPKVLQASALTYNPNNATILAETRLADSTVTVFEIDTATQAVKDSVLLDGLTLASLPPLGGGIIEDSAHNRALVAGTGTLGILDTSKSPAAWDPTTVVQVQPPLSRPLVDSMALNAATGLLFLSTDGSNAIVDTTKSPLNVVQFTATGATTDGVSFDFATNIMIQTPEFVDESFAWNFATLDTTKTPATALNVTVPGLGTTPPFGEGPGGQAVINCSTHQAVVSDEFGQNFKLIHLPTAPVTGALNNNGQPGTGTTADAASAFTIAAAIIPMGDVNGTQTQLGIVGDPNSLTIDPAHDFGYMLADTEATFHDWAGGSTIPLFLVRVDLSKPVLGGSPTGGVDGKTFWKPISQAIPMPSK